MIDRGGAVTDADVSCSISWMKTVAAVWAAVAFPLLSVSFRRDGLPVVW